jgi:hypothetical protein
MNFSVRLRVENMYCLSESVSQRGANFLTLRPS